jgi:hypothetical protein
MASFLVVKIAGKSKIVKAFLACPSIRDPPKSSISFPFNNLTPLPSAATDEQGLNLPSGTGPLRLTH